MRLHNLWGLARPPRGGALHGKKLGLEAVVPDYKEVKKRKETSISKTKKQEVLLKERDEL